jgi:Cd(II)/Pb(II)-responsive transcriptional regulator
MNDHSMSTMKIGDLARRTDCLAETIRYYEREGLLPAPARSEGNYRLYGAPHVERLTFIRHCRSLDMTLDEIRSLLHFKDAPDENCGEVNALLDKHIGHVADRIAELRALETQLVELRARCGTAHAARDCRILQELGSTPGSAPRKAGVHGGGCH